MTRESITVVRNGGVALMAGLAFIWAPACGGEEHVHAPAREAGVGATVDAGARGSMWDTGGDLPPSRCAPTVTAYPLLPATHYGSETDYAPTVYNSNPPSSGPHCPSPVPAGAYVTPVSRCAYIHNLEHGFVVLLYNCGSTECPDVVEGLKTVARDLVTESTCRFPLTLLTPDPDIPTQVAAVAWGWTFTASCWDEGAAAALARFAREHYAQGPEDFCL